MPPVRLSVDVQCKPYQLLLVSQHTVLCAFSCVAFPWAFYLSFSCLKPWCTCMRELPPDTPSDSSASTVHLAIQGLHNTFYQFRRQQLRHFRLLLIIVLLLCFSAVLQLAILIFVASLLRHSFHQNGRSNGGHIS